MKIVAGDIGGTHARFALAELRRDAPPLLGEIRRYRTGEHAGLASAWAAFARDSGFPLPGAAALGVAAPIEGESLRFTNSHWTIDRHNVAAELELDQLLILNDFGAVANAVGVLAPEDLQHLCGPDLPVPAVGVTTVMGPGTGLGISMLLRRQGAAEVIETEGSHLAFAPQTSQEARVEAGLRALYGRCSVERIVSGPGLIDIYAELSGGGAGDAAALWTAAIDGSDPLAAEALDLLIGAFGAAAGDVALVQGASCVVVTGGLANRLKHHLRAPLFHSRFTDKGRYRGRMERIPVLLATYPEPGLLGAAVAFQRTMAA